MHASVTKTLIVIRHGESEWNATPRPDREEFYFQQVAQGALQEAHNAKLLGCKLRDARITAKGRVQCAELKKLWTHLEMAKILNPELVVVSPLTRAMETASIVFADSGIPVVLYPGFQEHVVNICDVGRPVSALAPEFPKYDFSQIQDNWWNVPMAKETAQTFQQRVQAFQAWLYEIPQQTVVLVGHGHFLREFMRGTPSESAYMRNTEFRIMEFPALPREVVLRMDTAIVTCGLRIQLEGPALQLLTERVKLASKLFFQNASTNNNNVNTNTTTNINTNNAIMIMTGGATSKEVLTAEASVMKLLAIQQGVPPERVFVEDQAIDTIENAMFVKNILDKTNIRKVVLVTSEYHLQRALLVFQRVFGAKFAISAFGASTSALPQDELRRIEGNEKRFIAQLDELFRQKQPAAIKLPSPRTVISTGKGMAKFEDDGRFKHFPGNTVVCMIPRASKQFQVLVQAQQLIRQSPIAAHFVLLPPSSLHMTIYDLNSTTPPGLTTIEKNMYWRESNKKMQLVLGALLESADWTIFRMGFASMTHYVNLVNLIPATPRVEKALAAWRANLQMRLFSKLIPSDYGFHCTLGYVLDPIHGEAQLDALKNLHHQLTTLFSSSFGELELEPPRLTRFSDMSEFLPLIGHMDTALVLGYDFSSGFACFAHLYEFGTGLELRNCRWSNNWTHFVPFVLDSETYYIAYKQSKGTLHIVNAKTAHTIIDIIMTSTTPGFTHVVYVSRAGEPLAVFYNNVTNEMLILHIDLRQSTVSPFTTTNISPGGHTHLIECGGQLLAYSATTGDLVTFQIEASKRVISSAFLPLGKGISILASLSAGFAPENSTPGRFFSYTATTGKVHIFAFSDSGFASTFETTLDTGLSLVQPARFGDSDYIFTYRGQNGELQVFRSTRATPSTFTFVAKHPLPLFLTSLIFLDRRAPVNM